MDGRRVNVTRGLRSCGVVLLMISFVGCGNSADDTREILRQRQSDWARSLQDLTARGAALEAALVQAARSQAGPDVATIDRLRAVASGIRQASSDFAIRIRQVEPRIENELKRGGDTARRAIEAEDQGIRDLDRTLNDRIENIRTELRSKKKG